MILGMFDEAIAAGAPRHEASKVIGISMRTLQRWRCKGIADDNRSGPKTTPRNKLSAAERKRILRVLTSKEFRDHPPSQVVPRLADQEKYLASESTMYRILHEEKMQKHREPTREPRKRSRPRERVAVAPNQVWSWDISYMRAPVRGMFFYLYIVIDVFSRKIVAHGVFESECGETAADLIAEACDGQGVKRDQLVLHSDNGSPMKSSTLLATLDALGVTRSLSRPRVSNDNPYSESLFGTVKTRPNYPTGAFASLAAARLWVEKFVRWYNTEHRHSGIRFVTPEQRHSGEDVAILKKRTKVYEHARKCRPERWTGGVRIWSRIEEVRLNPEPRPCEVAQV